MTLSEIVSLLEAAERRLKRERQRQENEARQKAIMYRNLSLQTGESVACLFDKNKRELTPLSDYYPGLFKKEDISKEMSLEAYTALFEDFAYRHNQRRKLRRGGDADESGYNAEEAAGSADRQYSSTPISDGESTGIYEPGNE